MKRIFATIDDALEWIASGRVVIVLDSEDRENEADFVAAAESVTPQMIHFMISQGRGLLCTPVQRSLAERLQLSPLAPYQRDLTPPKFTVPIDHITCGTGISPVERAQTIRFMLDPHSRPEDFVRPGHVFPLVAEPDGVLARTGHTESAVDLARLAGLTPAGVLCEICSRDGMHMAGLDELQHISRTHRLPIITVDSLVEHCRRLVTPTAALACSD